MKSRDRIRRTDRKLAELILFVSARSEGDARFGAVKLNKLLFYIDFLAYLLFGKSITGQLYQKLANGPAPRKLLPVRQVLVDAGHLAIRNVEYFNYKQDRTFALREPDLSLFSADEVALVTEIIQANWGLNASQISHLSHQFHGWEDSETHETIPYEVALLSKRSLTEKDRKQCRKHSSLAKQALSGTRKLSLVDA